MSDLILMRWKQPRGVYEAGHIGSLPRDEAEDAVREGWAEAVDGSITPTPKVEKPARPLVRVEVPDDWRKKHYLQRVRLAREITGDQSISRATEADIIIERHLSAWE